VAELLSATCHLMIAGPPVPLSPCRTSTGPVPHLCRATLKTKSPITTTLSFPPFSPSRARRGYPPLPPPLYILSVTNRRSITIAATVFFPFSVSTVPSCFPRQWMRASISPFPPPTVGPHQCYPRPPEPQSLSPISFSSHHLVRWVPRAATVLGPPPPPHLVHQ
jgi:hypothetical protein